MLLVLLLPVFVVAKREPVHKSEIKQNLFRLAKGIMNHSWIYIFRFTPPISKVMHTVFISITVVRHLKGRKKKHLQYSRMKAACQFKHQRLVIATLVGFHFDSLKRSRYSFFPFYSFIYSSILCSKYMWYPQPEVLFYLFIYLFASMRLYQSTWLNERVWETESLCLLGANNRQRFVQ